MPFGYSEKIFSRPAVEYIPLLPLESHSIEKDLFFKKPKLILIQNNESNGSVLLKELLPEFSIITEEELGLAVINASFETIKYRGNYISVVIKNSPGYHQTIKIATRYFYKSHLIFVLIDKNGKIYSQSRFNTPNKR
ncbi:MAG: hypothetical protein KAX49_00035 [Halanaerobiales bacterium]|nr:hypothetical protein [Halanaerobiales bacterium]